MTAEQSQPSDRFKGLVPEIPLPDPIEDPRLSPEEQDAQRFQQELLRRHGPPGAAQQQVSEGNTTSDGVTPNQVRAGLNRKSVPLSSRQATEYEVRQHLARPRKNVVIFDDDMDRYPIGSVERAFLDAEKEMNKKKKKGA